MNDGLFASASDFCSNAKDAQKYRLALYYVPNYSWELMEDTSKA